MKGVGSHKSSGVFLFYFLVSLAFAGELLLPGRSLYRWDTLLYNWPILLEARSQILSGHWPFWASSFCNGTPLLANINAGVLYPMRLLCWLLPLRIGYHLFLFAHVWLTFAGMHLFLRRGLRVPMLGAVAGALVFGASGYARGMWDTHNFMALPWIPLGLAALLDARQRERITIPVVLTSVCWCMMILGGDSQAAFIWVPVALLLIAFLPERIRLLRVLGYAVGLSILITAAQWLPAFVVAADSYRAGGLAYGDAVERSFNPVRIVEFLLPHAFGTRDAWFGAALDGPGATKLSPWVSSMHVGLLAWVGIFFALRRRKRPAVLWSLILGVGSLFLSFGKFLPLYRLWLALPVIGSFRCPEKYLLWTTLSLATLTALGFPTLIALFRRSSLKNPRHAILAQWSMVMLAGAMLGMLAFFALSGVQPGVLRWMRHVPVHTFLTLLLVLVASLRTWPGRQQVAVILLLMIDLMLPWYKENPTTSAFNPVGPAAVARVIASSDSPQGRFLRDRAVARAPLPWNYQMFTPSERQCVFCRESLYFNSPRIWGLRSADGFSPTESAAMREFRLGFAAPDDASAAPPERLAQFCRQSAVEWLMTTQPRMEALAAQGLAISRYANWGGGNEIVLARIGGVKDVHVIDSEAGATAAPVVGEVWRQAPGRIRIDLGTGRSARLVVSESYARGWRAADQDGNDLVVSPENSMFIGVDIPAETSQVRLVYEPPEWAAATWISLSGLVLLLTALAAAHPRAARELVQRPAFVAGVACLAFVVLGLAARSQWSCMYDEGFHVTRGLARLVRDDSRLSYFHPPLQNIACGYFANLAFGERLHLPETKSWRGADALLYAVDVASKNADFYPDLIQASRMGTLVFSLLLCVVAVHWASKNAGPMAAWLTACGLALNPNMLVHGNISTTDMGVTALTFAGSAYLWTAARQMPWRNLFWSMLCFVFAAVAKFTGLIWLAVFIFFCVPWMAYREKKPALLFISLVGIAMLALALLVLYGPAAQAVRVQGLAWSGARVMAGRYFEGVFVQADHAMAGHRAFFHGALFDAASWWHLPAAVMLKTPVCWMGAAVLVAPFWVRRLRRSEIFFPFLPTLAFALLLFGTNRLAIGVRHALPLMAIATAGVAVAVANMHSRVWRHAACLLLLISSLVGVATSFPQLVAYFPAWAGGASRGHRWLVDSNYDWGQELGALEAQWAGLTEANKGEPPNLVYYGFIDPRLIYHLRVGPNSYCGYMEMREIQVGGEEIETKWKRERFGAFHGTTVASISALALHPDDIDFSILRRGREVGQLGRCFLVYRSE